MPELTLITPKFAEAPLVVRALLLLLGRTLVRLLGMPVDTLGILLMAVTIFFEKLTDWDLLFDIHVKILTSFTFATDLF